MRRAATRERARGTQRRRLQRHRAPGRQFQAARGARALSLGRHALADNGSLCAHSRALSLVFLRCGQVAPGSYLLEVLDTQSVWPTVRLDVSATSGKARALLTHSRQPLPFPLPLEPLVAKPTFFEKREGFNWGGMLMNPMVLMMGVTLLIMVVFPKMMANMDPEQLKEMQAMQGGMADMCAPRATSRIRAIPRALAGSRTRTHALATAGSTQTRPRTGSSRRKRRSRTAPKLPAGPRRASGSRPETVRFAVVHFFSTCKK